MVHPFLRLLYASALVAVVTTTAAQSPEAQLASLDSLFGGTVRFKFDKRHQLLIDYYDASGRFRQDIVPLEQMDADLVSFSLEEDAVIIRCKAEHGPCMSKELFKLNTIRRTGRSNLPRPIHDPAGTAAIAALQKLLHSSTGLLTETHPASKRMN